MQRTTDLLIKNVAHKFYYKMITNYDGSSISFVKDFTSENAFIGYELIDICATKDYIVIHGSTGVDLRIDTKLPLGQESSSSVNLG
jgi:hypothetical protein